MRTSLLNALLLALLASPAHAAAAAQEGEPVNLLSPNGGLMFWTLLIFIVLLVVLSRFAFKPLLAAVEAREKQLQDAIEGARRDREEAAELAARQREALEATRTDAQRIIAEGRKAGESLRAEMLEHTRQEQQQLLERARQEIALETERAIAALRREAVDLAIAGASKVIERNLDDAGNRRLIENYLANLAPAHR